MYGLYWLMCDQSRDLRVDETYRMQISSSGTWSTEGACGCCHSILYCRLLEIRDQIETLLRQVGSEVPLKVLLIWLIGRGPVRCCLHVFQIFQL